MQDFIICGDLGFFPIKKQLRGTGEMAHQLQSLAALLENLGPMPSTHMGAHNCL